MDQLINGPGNFPGGFNRGRFPGGINQQFQRGQNPRQNLGKPSEDDMSKVLEEMSKVGKFKVSGEENEPGKSRNRGSSWPEQKTTDQSTPTQKPESVSGPQDFAKNRFDNNNGPNFGRRRGLERIDVRNKDAHLDGSNFHS